MWKFLAGLFSGASLAFLYVVFNVEMPEFLRLSDNLKGNLISASTEQQLYESPDPATRLRALEIFFDNRAGEAAAIDAEAGHPFLAALHRARATREARQLSMAWDGYDDVLKQPALRNSLIRRHGVSDDTEIKQAMLWDELQDRQFLRQWLEANHGPQTPAALYDTLVEARRDPALVRGP